jgi:formylglycine-generating enzyme required for sulfatase activity
VEILDMDAPNPQLAELTDDDRQVVESWLVAFDQQWDESLLASRVDQIPPGSSWRVPALAEMVKIDLERQWQHGSKVSLETYLAQFPELGTAEDVSADLIAAEYEVRLQFGAPAGLEEYRRRFPHQAAELVRRIAGSDSSSSGLGDRPRETAPWLPATFGRYRIIRRLGQGGMGSVYLAEDTRLGRRVALKVPDFGPQERPEVRQRFLDEARTAATLDHPNLCPVFDAGEIDGRPYLTMAYIAGQSLAALVGAEDWPERQAADLVQKLALAMEEAHTKQVIHRDLKPANVMIKTKGGRREPVIVDFGLAHCDNPEQARLTRSGEVMGTPAYMAPEQIRGDLREIGPACDIYALGVILYELLTGRLPFHGSGLAVAGQILTETPLPPSRHRPGLDPRTEAICLRAMAKQAEDRYTSMAELAADLTDYLQTPAAPPAPISTRRWPRPRLVIAAGVLGALLLGIALALASVSTGKGRIPNSVAGSKAVAERGSAKVKSEPTTTRQADASREKPPEANPAAPARQVVNSIGMKLALISAGSFEMGGPDSDPDANSDEKPRHPVRITRPFYLGIHEVTQDEYRAITGAAPSTLRGSDDLPVETVNWFDAIAFCNALSLKEGLPPFYVIEGERIEEPDRTGTGYRLPTEAEWEYACRAGSATRFCFGDDAAALGEYAWYGGNSGKHSHPVGQKRPNAWGLYDMHGNVAEWCWDGYEFDYYWTSPGAVPFDPSLAAKRMLRGASWGHDPRDCRSAYRGTSRPGQRDLAIGFRVARGLIVPHEAASKPGPGRDLTASAKTITNPIGMKLALIPAGEFLMGLPDSDPDADPDEKPQHRVQITRPFYLGVHEVTQAQYRAVTGATPSTFKRFGDLPVETVGWLDAIAFCNALSRKEGLTPFYVIDGQRVEVPDWEGAGYRLPTEAEWEYACRAGSATRFCFGDDAAVLGNFAWYSRNSVGWTHPVGQKQPNAWGLYDMHGNVAEWCWDGFIPDSYQKSPGAVPFDPSPDQQRLVRGGNWYTDPNECRSAYRCSVDLDYRDHGAGFRVSRSSWVPPGATAKPGPEPRLAASPNAKSTTNAVGMELALIPAGAFLMGLPESDQDAPRNQTPQHPVRIRRPFYLGVHEVTQAQYWAVTGATPSALRGSDVLPVETVNWFDVLAFCNALSRKEGLPPFYAIDGQRVAVPDWDGTGYRLPTEAEWEYACRAGSTARYCFGDDAAALGEYAWYAGNSGKHSHPVGQKRPNAWGLHDMHGNVAEWCWDGYQADYYSKSPGAVPRDPSTAADRLIRGGSWTRTARDCRSTYRGTVTPDLRDHAAGLRVARNAASP